jgi:hypothetical protein
MLNLERQVKGEAPEPPVRFLEYLYLPEGCGGPQKPFSWLSKGYSPSTLKLMRRLVSPASTSRDHHVLVVAGAGGYPFASGSGRAA